MSITVFILAALTLACGTSTLPSARPVISSSSVAIKEAPTTPTIPTPEFYFLLGQEAEAEGRNLEAYQAFRDAVELDGDSVYLLRRAAELASHLDRIDEAIGYAKRALDLAEDDIQLRLLLATMYEANGAASMAEGVLLNEEGDPFNSDAAIFLYGLLAVQERFDEAELVARALQEMEPHSVRGTFALADLYQRKGDVAASEKVLHDGLTLHPENLRLYSAIALSRRDQGNRIGELEIYEKILALHPGHLITLLAQSEALVDIGKIDSAIVSLHTASRIAPSDLRIVLRLAYLHFEALDYKAAIEYFQRVLIASPEQYETAYFMGIAQLRARQEEEAQRYFESIPAISNHYVDARMQIAAMYERKGDYRKARKLINEARGVFPSRPLDFYQATLQAKVGDIEGAVAFLTDLADGSSEDLELFYQIGILYGDAQNPDKAFAYMEQVLARDSGHPGALNYVGYSWAEEGVNLDEAERYINRALERRPEDGYITDSLGWVYYMQAKELLEDGRREEALMLLREARVILKRASDITGGDPVISEHLGDVHLSLGERLKAFEFYTEAITLGPRLYEQPDLKNKHESLRQEFNGQ